jgi:hypothetical protein
MCYSFVKILYIVLVKISGNLTEVAITLRDFS